MSTSFVIFARRHICTFINGRASGFLSITATTIRNGNGLIPCLQLPFFYFVLTNIMASAFFRPFMAMTFASGKELSKYTCQFSHVVYRNVSSAIVKCFAGFTFRLLHLSVRAKGRHIMFSRELMAMNARCTLSSVKCLFLRIATLMIHFFRVQFRRFLPLIFRLFRTRLPFRFPTNFRQTIPLMNVIGLFPFLIRTNKCSVSIPTTSILICVCSMKLITVSRLLRVLFNRINGLTIYRPIVR